MIDFPAHQLIGQRYELLAPLGSGAMGQVFRARDRLSGRLVALKQVLVAPTELQFASRPPEADSTALLLALAHEFRMLASLRHPHIISVLDYGFDADQQPFFTMELLAESQPLLAAGQSLPLSAQVGLLIQLLQALAYLHQRDILHHDLKPDNVLVSDGQVRVLDFGLAVARGQSRAQDSFGTLFYLAPEVLNGEPYTVASDLYAVGVMAYELLVGVHPFAADTVSAMLDRLVDDTPDVTPLAHQPGLAAVIGRLLAKQSEQRFASAIAVIEALYAALGSRPPPESITIRESFLQAATFVGRDRELAQLRAALAQTVAGQAGSWLIGGESGVGKSRLLEELRAEALVTGALVLHGQAVAGVGLPYQIWRAPLRRLALSTPLDAAAASVLQSIVPDLERLLGWPIGAAPLLDTNARHQRLISIILAMIKRQTQPLVLLLEDLHWADESLDVLAAVMQQLGAHPFLVVGSYRDDERPQLPAMLPGAQVLKLARLDSAELSALSVAMLGQAGQQPEVLALLARETEGNAFFTVEVVRALAETAGGLLQIGHGPLPIQVVAGGVQQLIGRRLDRVPERARALLIHAAVLGRQLDLDVLRALVTAAPELWPAHTLELWLQDGANTAVLDLANEHWQFAHDKLREGLLAQIDERALPDVHAAVAQAIEATYASEAERATYAEPLMNHWRQAGDPARELVYLDLVVAQMTDVAGAYAQSRAISLRGLTVLDTSDLPGAVQKRIRMLDRLGEVATYMGEHATAEEHLLAGLALAQAHGDAGAQLGLHLRMTRLRGRTGEYQAMRAHGEAALALAEQIGDRAGAARALNLLGNRSYYLGDYRMSERYLQQANAIYTALEHQAGLAATLNDLGVAALEQGSYQTTRQYFAAAAERYHAIGSAFGRGLVLMNQGSLLIRLGEVRAARAALEESLAICETMQVPHMVGSIWVLLGRLSCTAGDYVQARAEVTRGVALLRAHVIRQDLTLGLATLALTAWKLGEHTSAHDLAAQCLAQARAVGERREESMASYVLGLVAASAGDHGGAHAHFTQSIAVSTAAQLQELLIVGLRGRGQLAYEAGDLPAAVADLSASIAAARRCQLLPQLAASLALLATIQAAQGHPAPAQATLHQAATIACQLELDPFKLAVLLAYAQITPSQSPRSTTAQIIATLIVHQRADADTRARALAAAPHHLSAALPTLDQLLDGVITGTV